MTKEALAVDATFLVSKNGRLKLFGERLGLWYKIRAI
jgi:hypothetical protein